MTDIDPLLTQLEESAAARQERRQGPHRRRLAARPRARGDGHPARPRPCPRWPDCGFTPPDDYFHPELA
jgi:hypothetical protein